jgi:hypothetical protein
VSPSRPPDPNRGARRQKSRSRSRPPRRASGSTGTHPPSSERPARAHASRSAQN